MILFWKIFNYNCNLLGDTLRIFPILVVNIHQHCFSRFSAFYVMCLGFFKFSLLFELLRQFDVHWRQMAFCAQTTQIERKIKCSWEIFIKMTYKRKLSSWCKILSCFFSFCNNYYLRNCRFRFFRWRCILSVWYSSMRCTYWGPSLD